MGWGVWFNRITSPKSIKSCGYFHHSSYYRQGWSGRNEWHQSEACVAMYRMAGTMPWRCLWPWCIWAYTRKAWEPDSANPLVFRHLLWGRELPTVMAMINLRSSPAHSCSYHKAGIRRCNNRSRRRESIAWASDWQPSYPGIWLSKMIVWKANANRYLTGCDWLCQMHTDTRRISCLWKRARMS